MNYAFTTKDHPAHPAWIARQVVESEGTVDTKQIGYFAGEEEPFAKLYQQYLDLNDKIKASMQGGTEMSNNKHQLAPTAQDGLTAAAALRRYAKSGVL